MNALSLRERLSLDWNWGAALLTPFWAFRNGLRLIGLVTLILWIAPLQPLAILAGIFFGFFGNRIAMQCRAVTLEESGLPIESVWLRLFIDRLAVAIGYRRSDGAEQAPGNAVQPATLCKWSWGAAVLGPFWAFSHGLRLIGLLMLILWIAPLQPLAILAGILLGYFGNGLAAKNRSFGSEESFVAIESVWSRWGLVTFIPLLLFVIWTWISFRSS